MTQVVLFIVTCKIKQMEQNQSFFGINVPDGFKVHSNKSVHDIYYYGLLDIFSQN